MNCPLCETPLGEDLICPNCGTQIENDIPTMVTEPELIPDTGHPGIFYENLLSSQETYEEEHKAPKAPRYEKRDRLMMLLSSLMLAGMLLLVYFVSGQYDPDAIALQGDGGIRMDNRTFSIYYQAAYQEFVSQYSDPLPFDTSRSLKKQYYNINAGYTWEDYFVSQAYSSAALTERVVAAAKQVGFTLDEAAQSSLDANWDTLRQYADGNKMSLDEYLQTMYGPDMNAETYYGYLSDSALAQAYTEYIYYGAEFTDAEIDEYYAANKANYTDLAISDIPNVDVRHILILPADDSEEADVTAKENAEDALAQCHSGGEAHVEEIFLNLVAEYSQDSGTNADGGLLQNLAPGKLGGEFDAWCFDAAGRKPGDTAVVSSQYGWHVVYFVGYRENYAWKDTVLGDMRSAALGVVLTELTESMDCHLTRFASSAD